MSTLHMKNISEVQVGDLWFSKDDPTIGWKVSRVAPDDDTSMHIQIDTTGHGIPPYIERHLPALWMLDEDFGHAERHVPDFEWPANPTDGEAHFYRSVDGILWQYMPVEGGAWAKLVNGQWIAMTRQTVIEYHSSALPLTEMELMPKTNESPSPHH